MDEKTTTTKVRSKKSEKEFLQDLTTRAADEQPSESGLITLKGAFPQVERKPLKDKTVNGMTRITY